MTDTGTDPFGLRGKVAAIIGGAGGIGGATTNALAKHGVDVAVFDRDADAIKGISIAANKAGVSCFVYEGDAEDPEAIDAFYRKVGEVFDRLDIVVNVVGGVRRRPFESASDEEDAKDIRLNYGYVVQSIKRAVPLIERHRSGGSIINFTTIEAHRGAAGYSVYAGAKAATSNLTRALAVEFGARRIRVNELAPDTTPSQGNMNALPPEITEKLFAMNPETLMASMGFYIPMGAAPEVEDLANGVIFLASDMARMVTGITLPIDGGTGASKGFFEWPNGDGFGPAPMTGTAPKMFNETPD